MVQSHITAYTRQKWERYSAMLTAAQSGAAASALPIDADVDRDAHVPAGSQPASLGGSTARHACAGNTERPTKRARTLPQQNRTNPDDHNSGQGSSAAHLAAMVSDKSAVDSRVTSSRVSQPAIALPQSDGKDSQEGDDPGWPPDLHDTVGCITVSESGKLPTPVCRKQIRHM